MTSSKFSKILPGILCVSVLKLDHYRSGFSTVFRMPVYRSFASRPVIPKLFLKATVNKTDRNDARGIAQMMRANLFRPVHVKTIASQQRRARSTARKLILNKVRDIENDIRGLLRNFGLKVGVIGRIGFVARIRELLEGMVDLAEIIEPLLFSQAAASSEFRSSAPKGAIHRSE